MFAPIGMAEQLMYSTVRITFEDRDGACGSGTGFFYQQPFSDQKNLPLIVTNKHVVANTAKGQFKVHLGEIVDAKMRPNGQSAIFEFDNFESEWFMHPNDGVDLCAMPFGPLQAHARDNKKEIFRVQLGPQLIPSQKELEDLDAVEEVIMVGYPNGLWDEANNFPLFRRGITASHPAIDFENQKIFVIDAACFPGSSGSPVVLINKGVVITKSGETKLGQHRAHLLGVLSSGPVFTAKGEIKRRTIPTSKKSFVETNLMMNLGFVEKASEIQVLAKTMIEHHKLS